MKKLIMMSFMTLIGMTIFLLPCFAADVIYGCYQKNNGQLRIVKNATECSRSSEVPIQWNQVGPQGPVGPQGSPGPVLDCSIPPTISYEYSCVGSILNIDLNITDDKEIAYYAIQEQGGDPPTNIITFVGPGLTSLNYQFTVEPGPNTRTLLFIASDTCGNTGKSLLEIEPNICSGSQVCFPGSTVSCYNGPPATLGVGVCKAGTKTCLSDGSGYGSCEGETLPTQEVCDGIDNNCDGEVDEGCLHVDQCFISGVYYNQGDLQPGNDCRFCNIMDPFQWTDQPDNSPCRRYPGSGVCRAGVCYQ